MSEVSARPVRAADRHRRAALVGVVVVALARLPKDKRFQETVITVVIALAALAALARESQARSIARLAAWDQRRNQRDLRPVKRA